MNTRFSPETIAYLEERHVANIVTLNRDGSPHIVPVWYECRDDRLLIITGASSVKARNIQRDPRVAVSIANDTSPASYVLIEGEASITTDGVEQATYDMYVRYEGQERGATNAQASIEQGESIIIVVKPEKVMVWLSD